MDINELIGRYLLAAAEHYQAQEQLGNPSALVRGNRAADELRNIATTIGNCGPTEIRQFSRLLDDPRNGVNVWVAFHILEVMSSPPDVVNCAFETLEQVANGSDMNALGTRMRLKKLRPQFGRPVPDSD